MMTLPIMLVLVLLLFVLTLVSYVEGLYTEMGKFLSREFQENIDVFEQKVEPRLGVSRTRASLSMSVLTQITTAAIALVIGYDVFKDGRWTWAEFAQASVVLILVVVIFNRLLPFVFFTRTKGEWLVYFLAPLRALIYLALPVTLVLGFA